MNKNKELAKNTFIITIGRISTQLINFLLLPLYTARLTTEEYGVVDLIGTYSQLLLPIMIFQMDQALLRFMIKERTSENNNQKCISTTYFFFALQIFVFSLLYFVVVCFIDNEYILFLYLTILATGLSGLLLQTTRGFGDNITYSISGFISGVATIICNIIFITVINMHAVGMILAMIIGNMAASLFILFKKKIFTYIKVKDFDYGLLKQMLKYAWPLIPNALIWWMVNASDRSIILLFLGSSANGILAVSHMFPSLIITVYNIFHLSWTESAALHLKEEDKDDFFSNVFEIVLRFFSAAGIMTIAILPFVFSIFVDTDYHEAYYQIPIFIIASLFNIIAGLYSVIYLAEMNTVEIAKTSLLAGLINVVLNLVLVSWIGLYAASISSAVSFGIIALYRAVDTRKYIKQKISYRDLLVILLGLIIGFFTYYSSSIIPNIIFLFFATIVSVWLNRRLFKKILGGIKKKIIWR